MSKQLTYKQLDQKAAHIVQKLKDHILYNGYHENLGQNDLRKFEELVDTQTHLSYQERYQLTSMLSTAIDSL